MNHLRRSGRSTRLLKEAHRLATQRGRAVYVIAADKVDLARLQKMFDDMFPTSEQENHRFGIKFETPDSCGNFNWQRLSLRGAHSNCVVLVDHFAIEANFSAMLSMLHKFD